jgi:anti-sigma-K factor RskA
MDCQEIDELAGAIALGALPPEEVARVREHLTWCESHPHLAELIAVGAALLWAAPEMEPPSRLRGRIIAAARAEPRRPKGMVRARAASWLRALAPYRVAAVLAVLVCGLLGWNLYLQFAPSGEDVVIFVLAGDTAHGRLIYMPESRMAVMVVEGLPPLSPGLAYQVWAQRGGQPTSVGLFHVAEPGPVSAAMSMDLHGVDAIAVTVEPEGGSTAPTTPPVLMLRL